MTAAKDSEASGPAPPPPRSLYNARFVAMFLAQFFMVLGLAMFYLLPLFLVENGALTSDVGLIMGVFALASVVARPTVSNLVDGLGRRRTFLAGLSLFILLPLIYLLFSGPVDRFFWPLVLVRLVHGTATAACFTASVTYVSDIVPPERMGEGMGIFGISGLGAMAVGPALGELVIRVWGFEGLFLSASLSALFSFVLIFRLPESRTMETDRPRTRFMTVLRQPASMSLVWLSLLFGVSLAAILNFVTLYAKEQQIGLISIFFVTFSLAAVVTRIVGGRLSDRIGEARIIPPALMISTLGLLGLIFSEVSLHFALCGFVLGVGHGFLFPSLISLALRRQPPHLRAKMVAIFTGALDGGTFAGSILLGWIGQYLGFPAIFLAAALCLGMAVALTRVRRL